MNTVFLIAALLTLGGFTAEAKKSPRPKNKSFEEIIFEISPQLAKDMKAQASSLDKSTEKKGYIKVEAQFEGRDQYFIFRGRPSDLVIHDVQGPELALKQDFSFYLVTKGEVKKVERAVVFPEEKIKKAFLNGRKTLDKMKKETPWKEQIESFELPLKGRDIKLILSNDDPNFFDNKTAEKATVATMTWTGSKFSVQKVKKVQIKKMTE